MAQHQSKLIQHLGIIAELCNEVKLAEKIDELIPKEKRAVSIGQAVQGMILNALGYAGRALYLTKRFFVNRPVEKLIGSDVTSDQLNDAALGTALDSLYEYGVTELFFQVASKILREQGIETRFAHLDSTTFTLHGEYNSEFDDVPEGVIHITKGYSKDNAPNLNQVVVQLISSNRSSIPIWLEALSGNTSDKKSFTKTVKQFQQQFKKNEMPFIVMDSAFYSEKNIVECRDLKWVTRVPETLKEVKALYSSIDRDAMTIAGNGYRYLPVESAYGGVHQRWLIVHSDHALEREMKTFKKNLEKVRDRNAIDLKHIRNQVFACEADARKAAERFSKKLRYQNLEIEIIQKGRYGLKGRPKKGDVADKSDWYIGGALIDDETAIMSVAMTKGLFVIATNELDKSIVSDLELLAVYKDQGVSVERGFRFLKDPMFYAESLYLKKPERIMALIMVMTLSLLVYSLSERRVRKALADNREYIWDQKNRLTNRPTIRWVCMIFEDVLLFYHDDNSIGEPMNIREEHVRLLESLGPGYKKMYFL
jgi:transposase